MAITAVIIVAMVKPIDLAGNGCRKTLLLGEDRREYQIPWPYSIGTYI